MKIILSTDKKQLGEKAAAAGAEAIRNAIDLNGHANLIVATGASQFEMLSNLVKADGIRWDCVTAFHLDEYVGTPITHPASFRHYLWKRFVSQLPLPLAGFHYINAEKNPQVECDRIGKIIANHPVDLAFVGIGENGHLAFNDPPADFDIDAPYLIVNLDEPCRKQQLGEGWFPTLADVPQQAISMSIKQIMKSKQIICSVPDERKSKAVKACVEGPVTNLAPASILQRHAACDVYLDTASASLLKG